MKTKQKQIGNRHINIDFMYIDLSVCTRCQGTDSNLDDAIKEVAKRIETAGIHVNVNKIHVTNEAQALELGFVVSPTIKVNGQDIQVDFRESLCDSCGTLCDCEGGVSCREWHYQGKWYSEPPKELIVEAILKAIYGGSVGERKMTLRTEKLPINLKRFFVENHPK